MELNRGDDTYRVEDEGFTIGGLSWSGDDGSYAVWAVYKDDEIIAVRIYPGHSQEQDRAWMNESAGGYDDEDAEEDG